MHLHKGAARISEGLSGGLADPHGPPGLMRYPSTVSCAS